MTKFNQMTQAEHMYIYDKKSLADIGIELGLSRRLYTIGKRNMDGIKRDLMLNTTKTDLAKNFENLQEK